MKFALPITLAFSLCGCVSNPASVGASKTVASEDLLVTGFPGLPRDAAEVAERFASCNHFSGEFTGDNSERNREVATAVAALRCGTVEMDVDLIRSKYAKNKDVIEALRLADEL